MKLHFALDDLDTLNNKPIHFRYPFDSARWRLTGGESYFCLNSNCLLFLWKTPLGLWRKFFLDALRCQQPKYGAINFSPGLSSCYPRCLASNPSFRVRIKDIEWHLSKTLIDDAWKTGERLNCTTPQTLIAIEIKNSNQKFQVKYYRSYTLITLHWIHWSV